MKEFFKNVLIILFFSSQIFLLVYKIILSLIFNYADIPWAITFSPTVILLFGIMIWAIIKFKNRNMVTLAEFNELYNKIETDYSADDGWPVNIPVGFLAEDTFFGQIGHAEYTLPTTERRFSPWKREKRLVVPKNAVLAGTEKSL